VDGHAKRRSATTECGIAGKADSPKGHGEPESSPARIAVLFTRHTSPMLKVFLSAGHSNTDPGAVANGVSEAALTLELRDALTLALADRGIAVMTDGRRGENLALRDAVKIAAKNPDGLNLEFHFNAGPPGAAGVEILAHARHKRVAQVIAGAIASVTRSPLRGENGWKPENAGQHHRLAFVRAGGLIVETCFISNAKDLGAYRARFDDVVNVLAGTIAQMAKGMQTGHKATPVPAQTFTLPASAALTTNTTTSGQTTTTTFDPSTPHTYTSPVLQAPAVTPSKPSTITIFRLLPLLASGSIGTGWLASVAHYGWHIAAAFAVIGLCALSYWLGWQHKRPHF
jgi:N-acetylmuramoyl-L-alanine amidase